MILQRLLLPGFLGNSRKIPRNMAFFITEILLLTYNIITSIFLLFNNYVHSFLIFSVIITKEVDLL